MTVLRFCDDGTWFARIEELQIIGTGDSAAAADADLALAPPSATFWPAYAIGLVKHAVYRVTGPHVHLIHQGQFVPEQPQPYTH